MFVCLVVFLLFLFLLSPRLTMQPRLASNSGPLCFNPLNVKTTACVTMPSLRLVLTMQVFFFFNASYDLLPGNGQTSLKKKSSDEQMTKQNLTVQDVDPATLKASHTFRLGLMACLRYQLQRASRLPHAAVQEHSHTAFYPLPSPLSSEWHTGKRWSSRSVWWPNAQVYSFLFLGRKQFSWVIPCCRESFCPLSTHTASLQRILSKTRILEPL